MSCSLPNNSSSFFDIFTLRLNISYFKLFITGISDSSDCIFSFNFLYVINFYCHCLLYSANVILTLLSYPILASIKDLSSIENLAIYSYFLLYALISSINPLLFFERSSFIAFCLLKSFSVILLSSFNLIYYCLDVSKFLLVFSCYLLLFYSYLCLFYSSLI